MTKEEYEQCKVDQYSDDPYKALQAKLILNMFPTEDTQYKITTKDELELFLSKSKNAIKRVLEDE